MKYELCSRVALAEDLPDESLRRGDIGTVVEYYQGRPAQEPGYELEVFNAWVKRSRSSQCANRKSSRCGAMKGGACVPEQKSQLNTIPAQPSRFTPTQPKHSVDMRMDAYRGVSLLSAFEILSATR